MKLFYHYRSISFTFSLTSSHLHPLQVENCGSNSRIVVDEDDNDKFKLERVNSKFKNTTPETIRGCNKIYNISKTVCVETVQMFNSDMSVILIHL